MLLWAMKCFFAVGRWFVRSGGTFARPLRNSFLRSHVNATVSRLRPGPKRFMGPADADQDLGTSDVTPELKKTVADGVLQEARDRS
jgi:hypothetical protein